MRMATPRSAESAITLQDAAEGVTEGVTESVTEESRGDDDIHIMSPTRNRSTARNLIIICSSPDEDPNDNMSDSTTALASPDAAVTTPPDDDGAEEEEEIIVVRSPAMRKRKGGVVLSSGDDDDMPVSKTATRSTTLHAAQTKTEESSAMKNASMDFDFGSDEDDDLPAAVDFSKPATAVHQRVTPKHGTPLKSLEEIVESSDATKELAHV